MQLAATGDRSLRPARTLGACVLLSAALHGLCVWWWQGPVPAGAPMPQGLEVRLLDAPAPSPRSTIAATPPTPQAPVARPAARQSAAPRPPAPAPAASPRPEPAVPAPPPAIAALAHRDGPSAAPAPPLAPIAAAAAAADAVAAAPAEPPALHLARLRAHMHALLAEHLSYPPLARRRGWQGEVLLGLRIESDGRLENLHIARSSGYGVLDQAALRGLTALQRQVGPGLGPQDQAVDLELPVVYQLSEG